jgi:predicted CXXCH cytochrome family protein
MTGTHNKQTPRITRILGYQVILMLLFVVFTGCSATFNYKLLSFLFDGVPNPADKPVIASLDSITRPDSVKSSKDVIVAAAPVMNYHPPYQEKDCASCHDNSTVGSFIKKAPELCYQCHDDFKDKYKVLHGPVASGKCVSCHSPHLSKNDHLLIRTKQALCLYCHDSKKVMAADAHTDIGDFACTECHNPHGGEDRYVLR